MRRGLVGVFLWWTTAAAFSSSFVLRRQIPLFSTTLSERTKSTDHNDDGDDNLERRNLRFAGVGRLYTQTNGPTLYESVIDRLASSNVMIVGVGGVGSWAAEAVCRSGVGNLVLVDLDDICISNTNRQLHTTSRTVGNPKIKEMKRRLLEINPVCNIELVHDFVGPDNVDDILNNRSSNITACLDAIDGTKGKSSLIAACARYGIPIVTCGGSAGRTDPTKFVCDDLSRVTGDPLLGSCRKTLRKLYGFEAGQSLRTSDGKLRKPPRKWNICAIVSTEPQKALPQGSDASSLRRCDGALGTACFVTGTSGFVAAAKVVEMIANDSLAIPRQFQGNKPIATKANITQVVI